MANFALHLFGTLTAIVDGREVSTLATDKARALLAYPAVEADRSHRRDPLAARLRPDLPQERARHSLRRTLSRRRQARAQHAAPHPRLAVQRNRIRIRADGEARSDTAAFATPMTEADIKAQTLHAGITTRLDSTTEAEIERRARGRDLDAIIEEILST